MIPIDSIVSNVIEPVLNTTGYTYAIFIDAGEYKKAARSGNTVTQYINTLAEMSDYVSQRLSNGVLAIAQVITLAFLLPLDSKSDADGNYPAVTAFRNALTTAFSQMNKFSLTVNEGTPEEITYVGGVSYSLPVRNVREIRTGAGDSLEYRATLQIAYLANAINTTDVVFTLDGTVIPYTRFAMKRTPNTSAVLTPDETNGEGACYSDVTSFTVDIEMPLLTDSAPSSAVVSYVLGLSSMNEQMTLVITFPGVTPDFTEQVIFGESAMSGEGVGNVAAAIRLVPSVDTNIAG